MSKRAIVPEARRKGGVTSHDGPYSKFITKV